jgi:hypothetical protein
LQVNSGWFRYFFNPFIFFIFNWILQNRVDWELGYIIFFIYFLWGYHNLITRVTSLANWLEFLFLFLVDFFFKKNYHSMLGWLRIRLHNLFWFAFYEVILISWTESRVWLVNSSEFFCFFLMSTFNIRLIGNWVF